MINAPTFAVGSIIGVKAMIRMVIRIPVPPNRAIFVFVKAIVFHLEDIR